MTSTREVQTLAQVLNDFRLNSFHAERLTQFIGDSDIIEGHIRTGMVQLIDAAIDLEELDQGDQVKRLQKSVPDFIDLEHKYSSQKETIQKIKQKSLQSGGTKDMIKDYEDEIHKEEDEYNSLSAKQKYGENEFMSEFKQAVWNVKHPNEEMPENEEVEEEDGGDDDDVIVSSTKRSLTCPLTTTWFEDPVTSYDCKHTFSKKPIVNMIRARHGIVQCPNPGCNKTWKMGCFFQDTLMERRVGRAKMIVEEAKNREFYDVE
ncbi:MIZ-type zinc finger transcription factor [Phycomyces blakesleeanus]|uniref:MIZ-type zinc finger transcription factor n=2 Tax=Phycomyces blakesleeanus TaxID=4837 RepID=A0A167L5E1_PHYB8|nr:MIZ-type zinc finger transcription factor [Phycomyces blakesleeanus NRRL 1555(-)]OAD69635.1 MIZ-type zinc finger transcription factor [Phycomyces blakesleeanus NRRL 1555(-)]|eukprot:XP_018287675.1 MIZ-type zinc finger transcription factor [Phycomyces blakesleeanus NRRL 1555(-)]